ncbi:CDP-glycerol glycerophosphotransferase family protein [Listeria aquatica]|uniref:CDP-glycerol glycerophosphotransferase family protein n=1 Tax=Listeria aquatica TaxID=1494960 RepID=UPI003EF702F7
MKKWEVFLLRSLFSVEYLMFACLFPYKSNMVTFASSRSNEMTIGMKLLYEEIKKNKKMETHTCIYGRRKNRLLKFIKAIQAVYWIARSGIIIVDDHFYPLNSLFMKFKRNKTLQIWHAAGELKKFGNSLNKVKTYIPHKNYDFVCVNQVKDIPFYAQALGVEKEQVKVTGSLQLYMQTLSNNRCKKKIIYAPTFRSGNYANCLTIAEELVSEFEKEKNKYELILSLHPYLKGKKNEKLQRYISERDVHSFLSEGAILITDYSSLILDFSYFERPILILAPDFEEYKNNPGFFDEKFYIKYNLPVFYSVAELMPRLKEEWADMDNSPAQRIKREEFSSTTLGAKKNILQFITCLQLEEEGKIYEGFKRKGKHSSNT